MKKHTSTQTNLPGCLTEMFVTVDLEGIIKLLVEAQESEQLVLGAKRFRHDNQFFLQI